MDGDLSQYEVDIDLNNPNTSHSLVADLVGRGKRVLDVGCWTGDLGRALIRRGCTVSGLEIDAEAAEKARADLDPVVIADLDATPLSRHFEAASFDAVVFADVLEHLRDPVGVLREAAALLAPGGKVVVSVPNITHGSVRLALLQGRWSYTDTGLLDVTHIRFFNRSGVLTMFADAGYVVEDLAGTTADPLEVEVVVNADLLPPTIVEWVRYQRDALVYQYVVAAHPAAAGEEPGPMEMPLRPGAAEEAVRLRDRFSERSRAELEARQEVLNVRDHIIGLEAATATAQSRAAKAEKQLNGARKRLDSKNERIKALADEVALLRRQLGDGGHDPVRGALGRLRRGLDR